MDVRAAVAFAARKPLSIETVQLDGPKQGEVLIEIKATGICHTDKYTLSGADPAGLFPSILGHEGADMIVGIDTNPARQQLARKFGLTHFVNPKELKGDLVAHLVELTRGGADYSFECIGNTQVMRQALECCHRGRGPGNRHPPVPAGHRPRVARHGLRRGPRPHRRPQDRRLVHGPKDQYRRSDHPHPAARAHQRGLRSDDAGGVDPQRRGLLRARAAAPGTPAAPAGAARTGPAYVNATRDPLSY